MTREIPGTLLVESSSAIVRGLCNHTRKPLYGSVLVVESLDPGCYDAIIASAAVICSGGGRTGHMESLCRSRGIPVLRVDRAELDAITGHVTVRLDRQSVMLGEAFVGAQSARSFGVAPADLGSICVVIAAAADVRATNALPCRVEQVTSFFVREEFICLAAGLSPLDALRSAPEEYGCAIAAELGAIAGELLPGQRLVMRLLDLRSDDATKITSGFAVSQEPNPDLGLHGARWLLASQNYPLAFRALRAGLGPDGTAKLSFAVPFVNDQDEYRQLRRHLDLPDSTRYRRSSRPPPPFTPWPGSAPPERMSCSSAPRTWCSSTWPRTGRITWSRPPTGRGTRRSWPACATWSRRPAAPRPRCTFSPCSPTWTTTSGSLARTGS
jgi:phosphohistidine swiveling domain-containing protein